MLKMQYSFPFSKLYMTACFILLFLYFFIFFVTVFNHGRISSVGRALDCRAGVRGCGFRERINSQGL